MTDRRQQLAKRRRGTQHRRRAGYKLDWSGTWWPKPGSICADGSIVVTYERGEQVRLVTSGVVYIDRKRLAVAERFGWRLVVDMYAAPVVAVGRT